MGKPGKTLFLAPDRLKPGAWSRTPLSIAVRILLKARPEVSPKYSICPLAALIHNVVMSDCEVAYVLLELISR